MKINISTHTVINQNIDNFTDEVSDEINYEINNDTQNEISNEVKHVSEEESNVNIDKSKIEQLENDRNQLLAVLEGSDDSLSSPKMDIPEDHEEEKLEESDIIIKQLEIHFKSEDKPLIKKMEKKKENNVHSEVLSSKHQGVFIETEPVKVDDDDLSERMELEQPEAFVPAKKSIFKSRNERNKKGMFLYKHSWVDKDKKVDEEKKEESVPNASPTNSFEEKPLQRVTKTTDVFDDDFDSVTSVKCNRKEKGVSYLVLMLL